MPSLSGQKESQFHLLNTPRNLIKAEGEKKVLVILVDFADYEHKHSKEQFYDLMFDSSKSVNAYYKEVSYGKFSLKGETSRWVTLSNNYSFYVGNGYGYLSEYPHNSQGLVVDAVKNIDSEIDFSEYDWDGDKTVDGIFFVHSGPGAEITGDSSDIWSHKWQLSDYSSGSPGPYLTDDGVYIDHYTIQPEIFPDGTIMTIGVFCHEFGHMLGLPDLYDIEPNLLGEYYNGLGDFSLMASGSWGHMEGENPGATPVHLDAWSKYLLGWVSTDSIETADEGTKTYILPPSSFSSKIVRILPNPDGCDWSATQTGIGEYFLVEHRGKYGYDASLPDSGLLILHIDESQTGNMNEYHPLVGIVQADKDPTPSLPPDSRGKTGDLWKDDTTGFTPYSIPPSIRYDGTPTGVYVKNISKADSLMNFQVKIGILFLSEISVFPNPFIIKSGNEKLTIAYKPNSIEKTKDVFPDFKVYIFNISGKLVRTLDNSSEIKKYSRYAVWDGNDEYGNPATSGLYFYSIEMKDPDDFLEKRIGKFTLIR